MLFANTCSIFNVCLRMCSQGMSAVNQLIHITPFPPRFAAELHFTESNAQVLTELLKSC